MARAARGVVIGVLIGLCPPPALSTGGYSGSALKLQAVTDTLPGLGALSYVTGTGSVVERTYRLANDSEATIVSVEVNDPDAGGLVPCGPGGRRRFEVAAWSSVTCTTRFSAVAGAHRARVVAAGVVSGVGVPAIAFANAGYHAAAPRLRLREVLATGGDTTVPVGMTVPVTYVLSNAGDVGLANLPVSDTLPVGAVSCGSGGPVVSVLMPGESHGCTARLRAAAGPHSGSAKAVGAASERSISPAGPGAPMSVEAVAYSSYAGVHPSGHPRQGEASPPTGAGASGTPLQAVPSTQPVAAGRVTAQAAPPHAQGQGGGHRGTGGGTGGHSLAALAHHHRRAISLLMILLIVALAPAVVHLARRGSTGGA